MAIRATNKERHCVEEDTTETTGADENTQATENQLTGTNTSETNNSAEGEKVSNTGETPSSSDLPLVNTIRNLLKRARNIKQDDAIVPVPSSTNNQTVSSTGAQNNGGSNNQQNQKSVVFDASMIIEAVESVQHSAATAHFFSEASSDDEILTTPTNITANSARVYQQLQQQSPDGNINAKNMYTIDMVGMLFEYILSDENLPDSVKTLLSHLHTPFLKLAFLDETFFETKEHKSRLLLDSLADAGAKWVNHNGTSQYDMYREIKKVVKRVVKEFKQVKKRISHIHELRERNSIAKKEGQERHDQAKSIAEQTIKSKIDGKRVPSAIIGLLSPWFTHLTLIHLKEGEESEKWQQALTVIDNLLNYCSTNSTKQNKAELEQGFEDINYSPSGTQKVLNELTQLKSDTLNKQSIKTTTTVEKRSSSATDVNGSIIGDETPTPEEERVMNYIKLIEPGTWIEYDKTSRHKVSGFNSEARKYVLIDQSSQEVMMLTRLQLARDILSERATVLDGSAKSLFERALDRIHHNLDRQVQASSP